MRFWTILATALLVAAAQFTAAAEARDQFNQKEAVTVDPQKSYIFFRAHEKMEVQFLREVTPEEHTAWVTARETALARAQQRYERTASEYRRAVETCRDRPPPCLTMDRPVPVTNENFAFAPAEADNFVSVTRGPQFSRTGDNDYGFLVAVPPGTYAFYGPVTLTGNGAAGFCMCMGSVRFEARAGQVVDLGEIHYPTAEGLRTDARQPNGRRLASAEITPYAPSMARPDRLNGLPVVPVELRAANKMPNYFGILIDRHPAVPGVLRYERDRVIDDRTGTDPVPLVAEDAP
jgi:hypothetical protein